MFSGTFKANAAVVANEAVVAKDEVPTKLWAFMLPETSNISLGDVVPIPTLPSLSIRILSAVSLSPNPLLASDSILRLVKNTIFWLVAELGGSAVSGLRVLVTSFISFSHV